jgi:hypothetical protein
LAARAGRGRHANVDFNALGATELRLNLFDDVELVAVRDRTVESRGARVWVGYIPGADHSEVFLTAKGGVMTGTISYEGRLFEILSANGATHAVREIDTKQIPEDIVMEAGDLSAGDLGSQGELTGADASTGQVIDVLVAYTPEAQTNAGGDSGMQTRILNAVAAANQGYLNSRIDIYLNLVHTVLVNYTETGTMSTALSRLKGTTDGYMDEVHALRDQYGADVVVLINTDTDTCGVSYVMRSVSTAFAGNAFAAVRDGCLASGSFAHEIGHLQGNMHDPESSSSAGAYPDSYGHRICGEFRDIMSYSCSGEPRINYFSNPDIVYQTWPTGVLGERDTARTMAMTAATVASFRPAVFAPTLPAAPSSLNATVASSDGVNLTWIDNASDESGYKVQGSLDGSTWAEIAALGPNVTGFADTGLVAGQTYYYRVYAFNGVGSSAFSNTASATLSAASSDTVAPTVTIKSPANGATVGWIVKISAVATDNVAVTGMKIFLNDKLLATSKSGSVSTTWYSYTAARGTHVIRAEASDQVGNLGTASITVRK